MDKPRAMVRGLAVAVSDAFHKNVTKMNTFSHISADYTAINQNK